MSPKKKVVKKAAKKAVKKVIKKVGVKKPEPGKMGKASKFGTPEFRAKYGKKKK